MPCARRTRGVRLPVGPGAPIRVPQRSSRSGGHGGGYVREGLPRLVQQSSEKLAYLRCWVRSCHECFTNENGVHANATQAADIVAGEDTALRHYSASIRNEGAQAPCYSEVNLERAQVAVIDADHGGSRRERAFHIRLVVHLNERAHRERTGSRDQVGQQRRLQDGGNQKD